MIRLSASGKVSDLAAVYQPDRPTLAVFVKLVKASCLRISYYDTFDVYRKLRLNTWTQIRSDHATSAQAVIELIMELKDASGLEAFSFEMIAGGVQPVFVVVVHDFYSCILEANASGRSRFAFHSFNSGAFATSLRSIDG
jgi:hypothetical protein